MFLVTILCPECQRYFQVPVASDEDGYYLPPVPPHEPCSMKPALESNDDLIEEAQGVDQDPTGPPPGVEAIPAKPGCISE